MYSVFTLFFDWQLIYTYILFKCGHGLISSSLWLLSRVCVGSHPQSKDLCSVERWVPAPQLTSGFHPKAAGIGSITTSWDPDQAEVVEVRWMDLCSHLSMLQVTMRFACMLGMHSIIHLSLFHHLPLQGFQDLLQRGINTDPCIQQTSKPIVTHAKEWKELRYLWRYINHSTSRSSVVLSVARNASLVI